ncbi:cytidine/deoxycytidylate deaminase family protein [Halobacterium rubrum]|uniref:cytidine deaminase n=1 Tax=Halobacterium TaxID=2239 RepID=UPI001F435126|nr:MULTISPECIES: cytidine deaminase [Halobacterium]MDH5020535.1 cytidine deaminase [Halobacterium rubrum]
MDPAPLTAADERLVERAVDAAEAAFSPGGEGRFDGAAHIVSAAVEASDGDVYTAASLPASVGRASTCAEPGALGAAVADGASDFERIVAVEHPGEDGDSFAVIPPCGVCRELLADYGDDVRVVVRTANDEVGVVTTADLLPARTW